MIPLKICFSPSGNNLRRLSILNGLQRAFQRSEDTGNVRVNFSTTPDYHFIFEFPTQIPSSQKVIYYDVEGLYESFVIGSPNVVFTVEENAIKPLEKFYGCPVFHLPLGFDSTLYSTSETKQEVDVMFCGTLFDPRPKVLSWLIPLSEEYNIQVITPSSWSSRFKERGNIKVFDDKEWFSPEEIVNAFLSSRIVLCINRSKHNKNGTLNKTIGRGFGETALKRCTFIDASREVFPYFIPGEEIITFSLDDDGEDLRSLVQHYLLDSTARESVAYKGFQRTFREHTWDCRVATILKILNDLP